MFPCPYTNCNKEFRSKEQAQAHVKACKKRLEWEAKKKEERRLAALEKTAGLN